MTVDEAIDQYLAYLRASQSVGTARSYRTGLRHLRRYLAAQELPPHRTELAALDLPTLIGFVTWLYEYLLHEVAGGEPARISEATKANYFAAVSSFLDYLIIETQSLLMSTQEYDALRKAFARAVKVRNREELPSNKLPSAEIVELLLAEARRPLALPEDTPPGDVRRRELARLRDIAIVEALVSSGMRVGELVRLERGHLLYEVQGAIVKYTKGKKDREVLFSDRAWQAIQDYFASRADSQAHRVVAHLPVFARHDRRAGSKVLPLSTRSIENILADLAERARILERFNLTPHTLRHYFATEFLSETGDLALTQYALGHASPTTTRIYAQTKREDYRRAHREVFGGETPDSESPGD